MALLKRIIENELEWVDVEKNIANRRFQTKDYFAGMLIRSRTENTIHNLDEEESEPNGIGFAK